MYPAWREGLLSDVGRAFFGQEGLEGVLEEDGSAPLVSNGVPASGENPVGSKRLRAETWYEAQLRMSSGVVKIAD